MSMVTKKGVTHRGAPAEPSMVPTKWRSMVPEYCALLEEANGMELHHGLFRVFGVGERCAFRDALSWNQANWRTAYGLPDTIVLWGENIFGDQFGMDTSDGGVVMLNCEGGKLDRLAFRTLTDHLESVLSTDPRNWIEVDLVKAAFRSGLHPSLSEHLSFAVPLMCGGSAEDSNMEVMDANAHLDVLGQLIEQSRGIPDGKRIRGFR